MSASRRAGGADDNIFAKLDRDGSRGLSGKPWKRARIAWCGLAGLAIIGLIAALAALARENLAVHRQPLVIEATVTMPEPGAAGANVTAMPNSGFAPLPRYTAAAPLQLAAAVDEPVARAMIKADQSAQLPPLVMLKPAAPAPVKPVVAPVPAKPVVAPAPAKPVAVPARAKPVATPAPAARSNPPKPAASNPAPKAGTARAPAIAATPRTKKPAAAAPAEATQEPAVDADVALLSAIIMQASRHSAERAKHEAALCGAGKKCAPKEDAPAQKATD